MAVLIFLWLLFPDRIGKVLSPKPIARHKNAAHPFVPRTNPKNKSTKAAAVRTSLGSNLLLPCEGLGHRLHRRRADLLRFRQEQIGEGVAAQKFPDHAWPRG